eukprot:CAMPEP_0171972342 /NCGR_PEP_ID=MMETSP0993-20121228/222368_1 /TAXON_ID=483369 /ORGANISM="non described non described, Strain CCMP2098" /LENGTH=58 /DNA_ID=CAMNT_0012622879 /DNA_START=144 /DNA_END=320 /DNA_ORIENTATION=+
MTAAATAAACRGKETRQQTRKEGGPFIGSTPRWQKAALVDSVARVVTVLVDWVDLQQW